MESVGLSKEEIARYNRQIILPGFGKDAQARLKAARVMIVGLGGLGSPASMYLAAAGVGALGIADFDKVDDSNLHRQILHDSRRTGQSKVESATYTLSGINPSCQLIPYPDGIHAGDLPQLFAGYDIVVDCTDNFPTRYMVNDACVLARKPLVYGSILQYEGQASFFHPLADAPCYRCLFPEIPPPGSVPNCAEAGVIGALCGIIGSIQAMEAIKYITGVGETLSGRLLVVDSATMAIRTLHIKRDSQCPVCSRHARITAIEASEYEWTCTSSGTDEEVHEVEAAVLKRLLEEPEPPYLLDVREPDECEAGMIRNAVNIPLGDLGLRMKEIPKDRSVVAYCYSGMRSMNAVEMLREKGYANAASLKGGVREWARTVDTSFRAC
jgi:adenylyltransferase/sulfurtransferase